jgi:hypothetical protein
VETNIDYIGFDLPDYINVVLGSGVDDCCAKCEAIPSCGAFTWTSNEGGQCWFKGKKGTTLWKAGALSAIVVRPLTPAP